MADSFADLLGATVLGCEVDYDFDDDLYPGIAPKRTSKPKPAITIKSPAPEFFKPVIESLPEGSILVAGSGGIRTLVQCEGCEKMMHERSDGARTCSAVCVQAAQRKERERIMAEKHETSDKVYRASRHLDGVGEEVPMTRLDDSIRAGELVTVAQEKKGGRRELPPLNPAAMVGMRRY